jgi:F0F1-type ATP synthase membrane subunit b/b'
LINAVVARWRLGRAGLLGIGIGLLATIPLPVPAQESSPDAAANTPVGTVFRWLNFLLVIGALAYLVFKFGAPYFRVRALAIGKAIGDANQTRAAAELELREASDKLAGVEREIEQERRTAERESAADRERIRALTKSELEKISQAGRAEIAAAERAGNQELRAIAARLATERAAVLIHSEMNPTAEAALFDSFLDELEQAAP